MDPVTTYNLTLNDIFFLRRLSCTSLNPTRYARVTQNSEIIIYIRDTTTTTIRLEYVRTTSRQTNA